MTSRFKIKFSRHAKRRIKLYKIDERDVIASIQIQLSRQVKPLFGFKSEFNTKGKYSKLKYPIRIVIIVNGLDVTVITAYPLKKEKKR